MQVRRLSLHQFRNFAAQTWELGRVTVFAGLNGAGKTSVLEALGLLATTSSFRAGKIEEAIQLGQELGRIQAEIEHDGEVLSLELLLTRGLVQGKKTQSRLYSVNGARRRKTDFLGNLSAVVFRPEDMRLIEGSPARRREFLDQALVQLDFAYEHALTQYEKALRTRNRLLQLIQEGKQPRTTLAYWTEAVVKHGSTLQLRRRDFLAFLNQIGFALELQVSYEPSVISAERSAAYLEKELIVGHSLIGPHKDDFIVTFPAKLLHLQASTSLLPSADDVVTPDERLPISAYGSRGQQRLAVLWLKLGELLFAEKKLSNPPVLLLDDLLSELDEQSRVIVLAWLKKYQTILTTADLAVLPDIRNYFPDVVEYRL